MVFFFKGVFKDLFLNINMLEFKKINLRFVLISKIREYRKYGLKSYFSLRRDDVIFF